MLISLSVGMIQSPNVHTIIQEPNYGQDRLEMGYHWAMGKPSSKHRIVIIVPTDVDAAAKQLRPAIHILFTILYEVLRTIVDEGLGIVTTDDNSYSIK